MATNAWVKGGKPLVDLKKCAKCKYHFTGSIQPYFCGYHYYTGHSRMSRHPEGLTSDCKEFEPIAKRGRPKKEVN